jgi:hypothetical protein
MLSRRLFVPLAIVLAASAARAQLTPGAYTIDPAGSGPTNYTTWAAAVAALSGGVSGPGNLTFAVASVTFNESVTFGAVPGTSSTTQVTFIASGAPAVIDCTGLPTPSDGLVLPNTLNYLNFENLEIRGFSRYGLHLRGVISPSAMRATFCTFKKIVADAPASTSSTINAVRNEYAFDCNFEECTFKGGGYVGYSQQITRNNYRRCRFDGKNQAAALLAPFNTNDADNLWENCFFYDCGPSGLGLYIDLSSYGNMFWHNTVIVSTSSRALLAAGCCAWSRANSFRNNVVINNGPGVAVTYGTATQNPALLDFNDLDFNMYYAPNGFACELQGSMAPAFTRGTLAQWVAYLNATPALIPPGGGTSWDQNSFEGDPGLLNRIPPYDIRLGTQSTCLDTGTTAYVAGPWISYPASYVPTEDIEKDPRPTIGVDIGADEAVAKLLGSGPGRPGTTVSYALAATPDGGLIYQVANSLGAGPIPIDTRQLLLTPDGLFIVSVAGILPSVFSNYANVLNQNGEANAALILPPAPPLIGVTIHGGFVTISPSAPSRIKSISTTWIFTVQP